MRYLIIALLIATGAHAEDLTALKQDYYATRPICRLAEDKGKPVSEAESAEACVKLEKIAAHLKKQNQCWQDADQEWVSCHAN